MKTQAKTAEEVEIYGSLGREIGRLLQHAKDIADDIRLRAEKDADAIAADAQRAWSMRERRRSGYWKAPGRRPRSS